MPTRNFLSFKDREIDNSYNLTLTKKGQLYADL